MNCSTVGMITRKFSNLEKEAQRRIEADERQIDPIDYTGVLACAIRCEVSTMCSDSHPAKHPPRLDVFEVDIAQWVEWKCDCRPGQQKIKEGIARRKERTAIWLLKAIDPAPSVKK